MHALCDFSSQQIDDIFSLFFQENRLTFHENCLLIKEVIGVKCLILFSGKKYKYFTMPSTEIFTQHGQR